MSQQEFETYLSVLSRLLRLKPDQREQVAEELRDHLETRLEELDQQGVPRSDAVRIALDEFGDAAGLAASFFSQVREHRRRWVMRLTTVSAIGLAAAVLLAFAIWPESNRGPAPRKAIAQQPGAGPALPGSSGPQESKTKGTRKATELEEKLAKRIQVEFVETPLKDVLGYLSDVAGVQIYVNRRALDDSGITTDVPVSLTLKDVRLDTVLDLALEQVGPGQLAYVERDGVLVIADLSSLADRLEVRVYNCRDLLAFAAPLARGGDAAGMVPMGAPGGMPPGAATAGPMGASTGGGGYGGGTAMRMMGGGMGGMGGGGMGGGGFPPSGFGAEHDARAQHLIQLVQNTVKPDSWSDAGGMGAISEYGGLIVVRQNPQIHREVEKLLVMLREAAGLPENPAPPKTGGAPGMLPGPSRG